MCQSTTTTLAALLAQRVRAQVPAAVLEPALLPGSRMPARSPPLASGAATGPAPSGRPGSSPTRRSSTRAPSASQVRVPNGEQSRGYDGAWSRSKSFFSIPLCDRPGCYEPPAESIRNPARYCCRACRQAMRNVHDRERKWRSSGTLHGRMKRDYEYQAARQERSQRRDAAGPASSRAPPQ